MITFRSLYEHELDAWFRFISEDIFPNVPDHYFQNQWYPDPWKDLEGIFVAVDEDDAIVGTIRVFLREIYIVGKKVKAGGIGSVGTRKDQRGRGYIKKLMQLCDVYLMNKDVKVAYLFSGDHNETFYNKFGYQTSPYMRKIASIKEDAANNVPFSVREAKFPEDISALSLLHEAFAGAANGAVVRNSEYWKSWIPVTVYGKYYTAQDENGKILAYICVDFKEDRMVVSDFGAQAGQENIFDSFISKIKSEVEKGIGKVDCPIVIPSETESLAHEKNGCSMFKCISPFNNVKDTNDLLGSLSGTGLQSRLLLWYVDNI